MLVVCALRGRKVLYSSRQIALSCIVGVLLLMGGNLTLSYAELAVSLGAGGADLGGHAVVVSGARFVAAGQTSHSGRGKAGLALGILGLFVLFWPELTSRNALGHEELWASLSLHWRIVQLGARIGAIEALAIWHGSFSVPRVGKCLRQASRTLSLRYWHGDFSRVVWTARGIGAVLYLVVCGSWIGYTAYI